MEEKKIPDDELLRLLEIFAKDDEPNGVRLLAEGALDLIHRLQDENNQIKSNKFASWKLKFFRLKEEFDKELAEHEEFAKKAKAEIERLKIDIKNEKNWGKIQTKQARKETAKEILHLIKSSEYVDSLKTISIWAVEKIFKEHYGVEVE